MPKSSFGYRRHWWLAGDEPTPPAFTLGTTKPDATNVGLTGSTSTILTGTRTYGTAGQTVQDTRFDGFVNVTASNVTFINCDFRGPAVFTAIDRGLVNCNTNTASGVLFQRCRFSPQTPTPGLDGIFGQGFTAERCEVFYTEDGFGLYRSDGAAVNVDLKGNWVHDLLYSAPGKPLTPADGSHCDCVQLHQNPRNINIIGNRFEGFVATTIGDWNATDYAYYPGRWSTSCIMYSPNSTTLQNVAVDSNWIDGGAVGLNFGNWTSGSGLTVTNNRWGRDFRLGEAFTIIAKSALSITITGNIREDDSTPYNARQNG